MIFWTLLVSGWVFPAAVLFHSPKEIPANVNMTIPTAALDLSDLDVRDEHNRAVRSESSLAELKNLFVQNLAVMLSFNLTPYHRTLVALMSQSWTAFAGWLTNAVEQDLTRIQLWWAKRKIIFDGLFSFTSYIPIQPASRHQGLFSERHSFGCLVSSIISSTVLLR